jgi:hypothetical protein
MKHFGLFQFNNYKNGVESSAKNIRLEKLSLGYDSFHTFMRGHNGHPFQQILLCQLLPQVAF